MMNLLFDNLTALPPETTVAEAAETMGQSEVISNSLVLMGQGMAGIFLVMIVIALVVYFITKFSK